ncbi:hypothetical protein C8J56DRAFT_1054070 [Mycena floridula]|nr:hypothetical protein C8J56DRAFT_1054070 [Mycena floridula]
MSNTTIVYLLTQEQVAAVQLSAVGTTACASLGYGMYLLLTMRAIYVLSRRGLRKSQPRCVLLAAIVLMSMATTGLFVANISNALAEISSVADAPKSDSIYQRFYLGGISTSIAGIISAHALILISDVIVVWRAWVICDRRLVKIILSCCMAGSLTGIIFEGLREVQIATGSRQLEMPEIMTAGLSMLLPMLVTNSVATLTIAHKAWVYRCTVRKNSDSGFIPNRAHPLLLLFLKSGSLYIVIWALYFLLSLLFIPSASIGMSFLNIIVAYLLALYPVLIIILVVQQTPLLETTVYAPPKQPPDITFSSRSTILDISNDKALSQPQPRELSSTLIV